MEILHLFYKNSNTPVHLRQLSRLVELKEGPLSRHLNKLELDKILVSKKDGNLKKYCIKKGQEKYIYPFFDFKRFDSLPIEAKNALKFYKKALKEKPVFIILFGSRAKETANKYSDIDLVCVFNKKTRTADARRYAEAQTDINISEFQMNFSSFVKELKMKQDEVVQAAIETGYPVYNHLYYYEVVHDERENAF